MGMFEEDGEDQEEEEIEHNYQCMYDDCEEWFEDSNGRLRHSLDEHWNIDPRKYPNITDADGHILFDT
jgi:hypothetical protein